MKQIAEKCPISQCRRIVQKIPWPESRSGWLPRVNSAGVKHHLDWHASHWLFEVHVNQGHLYTKDYHAHFVMTLFSLGSQQEHYDWWGCSVIIAAIIRHMVKHCRLWYFHCQANSSILDTTAVLLQIKDPQINVSNSWNNIQPPFWHRHNSISARNVSNIHRGFIGMWQQEEAGLNKHSHINTHTVLGLQIKHM